ncbi:MAG: ABC transporter permease [Kiritimatiellae bacterium]|nr:ABC transporter permease [Kiritimatiellia bacterium]
MSAFVPLWQRETGACFRTSIAYTVGVFFLVLTGAAYWMLAGRLAAGEIDGTLAEAFFSSQWFWLAMLLLGSMLTMRLFAEEIRLGTLEMLMGAPVTETEVVLSKFASAGTVFTLLWLPTLAYPAVARLCGLDLPPPVPGQAASAYFGVLLLGAFFLSAGLFCSLLTKHQMVAAMLGFGAMGAWVSGGLLTSRISPEGQSALARALSAPLHMRDFAAGILDTRTIVLYLSATVLLLFCSIRLLEARRLR